MCNIAPLVRPQPLPGETLKLLENPHPLPGQTDEQRRTQYVEGLTRLDREHWPEWDKNRKHLSKDADPYQAQRKMMGLDDPDAPNEMTPEKRLRYGNWLDAWAKHERSYREVNSMERFQQWLDERIRHFEAGWMAHEECREKIYKGGEGWDVINQAINFAVGLGITFDTTVVRRTETEPTLKGVKAALGTLRDAVHHELRERAAARAGGGAAKAAGAAGGSPAPAPDVVVICEGSSVGNGRKDFDAAIYNRIFGGQHANVRFVSGGSSNQVPATRDALRQTIAHVNRAARIVSLIDRDDMSSEEVTHAEQNGNLVLPLRSLESFLWADDVIKALLVRENKVELLARATEIKQKALAGSTSRGNPADDLKSASGDIYNGLKELCGLTQCGNNADAFMRDTLAPLIAPGMCTYEELKAGIIDRVLGPSQAETRSGTHT